MKSEIKNLLAELYEIDPKLKSHEKKLIVLIEELLSSRPAAQIDEAFKRQLRKEVLAKAKKLSADTQENFITKFMNFNKLQYALGGGLIALIIAIPLARSLFSPKNINEQLPQLSFLPTFNTVKDNAFGNLAQLDEASPESAASALSAEGRARTQSGGGGGVGSSGSVAPRLIYPAPEFINVEYLFDGEIEALEPQSLVYKKTEGVAGTRQLAQMLQTVNLGLVNLDAARNSALQQFTIIEDRDFGYIINVDLKEGSISINENYERWDRPQNRCRDERCFNQYRIRENDIQSNSEIIKIANQFAEEYGLNLSSYGEPVVGDSWRIEYARAQNPSDFYFPQAVSVVYPLIIDGQRVFDPSGFPTGIQISVDILLDKVTGAYGLTVQNYERSLYDTSTDVDKIKEFAKRGGMYGYYTLEGKKEEVKLDNPERGFVQYYKYNQEKSKTETLLVPALIFPVAEIPKEAQFIKQNVVVPLVTSILEEQLVEPRPVPVPLDEPVILEQVDQVQDEPEAAVEE